MLSLDAPIPGIGWTKARYSADIAYEPVFDEQESADSIVSTASRWSLPKMCP
jgi:hypothetical protein